MAIHACGSAIDCCSQRIAVRCPYALMPCALGLFILLAYRPASGQPLPPARVSYQRAARLWKLFNAELSNHAASQLEEIAPQLTREQMASAVVNDNLAYVLQQRLTHAVGHCGVTYGVAVWEYNVPPIYQGYLQQAPFGPTAATYQHCLMTPFTECILPFAPESPAAPCREGGSIWTAVDLVGLSKKAVMVFYTPTDYYYPNQAIPEGRVGEAPLSHLYFAAVEECMDPRLSLPFPLTDFVSCVALKFAPGRHLGHVYSAVRGFAAIPIVPDGVDFPRQGYTMPDGQLTVDSAYVLSSVPPHESLLPLDLFPDRVLLFIFGAPIILMP